jgi:site-specific DNA recombinase
MTLRIGIYTRLSHDATGEQTATTRQEKACRSFAELRGWEVIEVFEDVDLSAYQRGVLRPSYERLLAAIDDGAVDGVLVWKLDRLVRRPSEFERFWTACEAHDVVLASATEPLDTSYELGLALVRILVTFAHLESATIGLRIKAKHRELAEAGRPNGPAPYGWRPGMQELEPAEAERLREALGRALAGETIHAIAADWFHRGVRTRRGKVFAPSTLKHALLSDYAVGDRAYHGEVVARDCFAAVMTRDEQAVLRATLATRAGGAGVPDKRYLLTGLLRCGRCGARLFGVTYKNRHTYTCSGKFAYGCNRLTVAGAPLEDHIYNIVLEHLRSRPPNAPRPVDPDAVVAVLTEHATQLTELAARTDLTRGQRGAFQAQIIGDLQRRAGLALIDGRPVGGGVHDAAALEAAWPTMAPDEQRSVLATCLHYIVILPAAHGPKFDPRRIVPVFWSTELRSGDRLRRIATRWSTQAPPPRNRRIMRQRRSWTDQSLLAALRAWAESTGSLSGSQYALAQHRNPALPSHSTIVRRFGSWRHALERAGQPNHRATARRYTDDDLREALRCWLNNGGDGRAASYARDAVIGSLPSFETLRSRFGSWRAALLEVGGHAPARRWSLDEVLTAVAEWCERCRVRPTGAAYQAAARGNPDLPSMATVTAKLGRWPQVVARVERAQLSVDVGSG